MYSAEIILMSNKFQIEEVDGKYWLYRQRAINQIEPMDVRNTWFGFWSRWRSLNIALCLTRKVRTRRSYLAGRLRRPRRG